MGPFVFMWGWGWGSGGGVSAKKSFKSIQWNLDIMNLYVTKSWVKRTIFLTPVIVKYMEKNLDMTKLRYS